MEEHIEENPCTPIRQRFHRALKAENIDKTNFLKINNFCYLKDSAIKVKGTDYKETHGKHLCSRKEHIHYL
jgi:hypothetical protein